MSSASSVKSQNLTADRLTPSASRSLSVHIAQTPVSTVWRLPRRSLSISRAISGVRGLPSGPRGPTTMVSALRT